MFCEFSANGRESTRGLVRHQRDKKRGNSKKTVQRFSLKPAADHSFRFRFIEVKQEVKKISIALQSASKLQSDTNIL